MVSGIYFKNTLPSNYIQRKVKVVITCLKIICTFNCLQPKDHRYSQIKNQRYQCPETDCLETPFFISNNITWALVLVWPMPMSTTGTWPRSVHPVHGLSLISQFNGVEAHDQTFCRSRRVKFVKINQEEGKFYSKS